MIVVTGAAGFIGSMLVSGLNRLGEEKILAVDDLTDGKKFTNLAANKIADYMDKAEFREKINQEDKGLERVNLIFHQGACAKTTEWNGRYMLDNNFSYSKELLHFAVARSIPFIYASSAAVYGTSSKFIESGECEKPINVYGYSKLLFDNYVRSLDKAIASQVIGLRYFNVYGPGEAHKKEMASVAFHLNKQLNETRELRLFEGSHGYADGEQVRDFIHVDDIVRVNLWMREHAEVSGIFNVGTGKASSFNRLAEAVIDWHGTGKIKYIPFPDGLRESYQSYTEADLSKLRAVGYDQKFTELKDGVQAYMDYLNN